MFFKQKLMPQICVIFLLTGLMGCGWLHDRNPPPGELSVNLGKYSCMYQIGQKVTSYMDGKMDADKVSAFAGCIRTALRRFTQITRGTVEGGYRPSDLQIFLNEHYLAKNQQLSDKFVKDIMDLKTVILGGTNTVLTYGELHKMINVVTFLQNQAIANLPYIGLYNHIDNSSSVDRAFLEQAKTHLRTAALDLAGLLQANNRPYTIESLDHLIDDAQKFLNWRKLHPKSLTADQFAELVRAHKYVVTGKQNDEIEPNDWPLLFGSISSVYSALVNVRILDQGPMTYGPSLDILIGTAHDIFDMIGHTIDQIPQKMISFASTDALFAAMGNAHLLPDGIRAQSLDDVYRYAIAKALRDPLSQPKGTKVMGLSLSQLNQLENEFDLWADSQSYLSDRAQQSLGFKSLATPNALQNFELVLPKFDLSETSLSGDSDARGREINEIMQNIPPYFRKGDTRAFIMPREDLKSQGVEYGMTDLTYMNFIHTLARLLVRGFASDDRVAKLSGDWTQTGVTESEMNQFYNVVHGLGVDLKFMYPKYGSGTKSFIEAKLFTYDGDGINRPGHKQHSLLNFDQIMEYITTLWSGGQVRNLIYNQIRAVCTKDGFALGPKDVFGIPKLNRNCFNSHFFDNDFGAFSNLPFLQRAFVNMTPEQKRDALFNLEAIAHIPCTKARYIEFSEIATIATVLHYVEAIFSVYDHNQDGVLDQYEIMQAYSRFNGYIARQVQAVTGSLYSVARLKSIFAFIVQNQRIPGWTDIPTILWYQNRYFNNDPNQFAHIPTSEPGYCSHSMLSWLCLPKMSLDRADILNVLRVLTSAGAKKVSCDKSMVTIDGNGDEISRAAFQQMIRLDNQELRKRQSKTKQ